VSFGVSYRGANENRFFFALETINGGKRRKTVAKNLKDQARKFKKKRERLFPNCLFLCFAF